MGSTNGGLRWLRSIMHGLQHNIKLSLSKNYLIHKWIIDLWDISQGGHSIVKLYNTCKQNK